MLFKKILFGAGLAAGIAAVLLSVDSHTALNGIAVGIAGLVFIKASDILKK